MVLSVESPLHIQLYIEQLVPGPASALPTLRDAGLRTKTRKILIIFLNSKTKNSYLKAVDSRLISQKPSYALKKIRITINVKKQNLENTEIKMHLVFSTELCPKSNLLLLLSASPYSGSPQLESTFHFSRRLRLLP